MRNPGGYAQVIGGDGTFVTVNRRLHCDKIDKHTNVWECDTFTCGHLSPGCMGVVHVFPKMDPADIGGLCKQCMKLICPNCVDKGCYPLEKALEQSEAKDRALRSYGM